MERLNAYTSSTLDGGVSVDVEGMLVDMVTIVKASGYTKERFLAWAGSVFDEITVNVKIPEGAKQ